MRLHLFHLQILLTLLLCLKSLVAVNGGFATNANNDGIVSKCEYGTEGWSRIEQQERFHPSRACFCALKESALDAPSIAMCILMSQKEDCI